MNISSFHSTKSYGANVEYAIVHRESLEVLERYPASSADDCRNKLVERHPEFECDSFDELQSNYPVFIAGLLMVPLS